MQNLETKPIPGFEKHYIINTDGDIFSIKRIGPYGPQNPKKLSTWLYTYGSTRPSKKASQYMVNLCRGAKSRHLVIDLAAKTFIGEPPTPLHRASPKDGNWENHSLANIEYQTFFDNSVARKEEKALRLKEDFDKLQAMKAAETFVLSYENNKHASLNLEAIKQELFPDSYHQLTSVQLTKALIEFGRRKREAEEAQTVS